MNQDYLIRLTLTVHRLSEWWSDTNLLKFKIRSLANETLTDFILLFHKNPGLEPSVHSFQSIQELQRALKQARTQKLINREDFLLLQKEYGNFEAEIKNLVSLKTKQVFSQQAKLIKKEKKAKVLEKLNQRQEKILEILSQKPVAQVREFKEFFKDTSKRTLRRDLDDLLKRGLIQRNGKWNMVFYMLRENKTQGFLKDELDGT